MTIDVTLVREGTYPYVTGGVSTWVERPGGTAGLHDVPDGAVVHALSCGTAAFAGAALARVRGVPLVLTEHGRAWHTALNGTGELESGRPPAGARRPAARAEARLAWARDPAAMVRTGYAEATAITTVCSADARRQRRLGAPAARSDVTPPVALDGERPAAGATAGGVRGRGDAAQHRHEGPRQRIDRVGDRVAGDLEDAYAAALATTSGATR